MKLTADLTVIALLQLTALVYGVTTIFQQRPVAVVFWENSFYSVPASASNSDEFDVNKWKNCIQHKLPFIYAEKPTTREGLKQLLDAINNTNHAPHHQENLY